MAEERRQEKIVLQQRKDQLPLLLPLFTLHEKQQNKLQEHEGPSAQQPDPTTGPNAPSRPSRPAITDRYPSIPSTQLVFPSTAMDQSMMNPPPPGGQASLPRRPHRRIRHPPPGLKSRPAPPAPAKHAPVPSLTARRVQGPGAEYRGPYRAGAFAGEGHQHHHNQS